MYTEEQVIDLLLGMYMILMPEDFTSAKGLEKVDFLDLPYYKAKELGLLEKLKQRLESTPDFQGEV
jgi:hypothetical protein